MEMLPFYISLVATGVIILEPIIMILATANLFTNKQRERSKPIPYGVTEHDCAPCGTGSLPSQAGLVKRGVGSPNDFK